MPNKKPRAHFSLKQTGSPQKKAGFSGSKARFGGGKAQNTVDCVKQFPVSSGQKHRLLTCDGLQEQIKAAYLEETGTNTKLAASATNNGINISELNTKSHLNGVGMHLLQKMGWKPGEGLGREGTGSIQPLMPEIKLDKRGLAFIMPKKNIQKTSQAKQFKKKPNNNKNVKAEAPQNMQNNKHPVSFLNELTSQRKWPLPFYTVVSEFGPIHNKLYILSVTVNGQAYTPKETSISKKEARVLAARKCLEEIDQSST